MDSKDRKPIKVFNHISSQFSENLKSFLKDTLAPAHWKIELQENNKLYLNTGDKNFFYIDYSKKKSLINNQPLYKAIGFKHKPFKILDATAGWGLDTILFARLNCSVTAIEKNKLVFAFLKNAFDELDSNLDVECLCVDSLDYLDQLSMFQRPDVIYLDFMFSENKKSLSKKPLCILQELLERNDERDKLLFEKAIDKTKKRLVIKRHRSQKSFKKNYLCSFSGHSVCFDVFNGSKME